MVHAITATCSISVASVQCECSIHRASNFKVYPQGLLYRAWESNGAGFYSKQGTIWKHINPRLVVQGASAQSGLVSVSGQAPADCFPFNGNKHTCTARGASITFVNTQEAYDVINTHVPPGRLFFKDGLLFRHTSGIPEYTRGFGHDNGVLYRNLLLTKENPVTVLSIGASGRAITVGAADLSYWEIPKQVATAYGHATTSCSPIDARIPYWTTASGSATTSSTVDEPQISGVATSNGLASVSGNVVTNSVYAIRVSGKATSGPLFAGKDDPSYPTVWHYVSVLGSDSAGNGSQERPYRNVHTAISAASSGHGIRILPGTYTLTPIYISQDCRVGMYDQGKALFIEGFNEKTILSFSGSGISGRDANLFYLSNDGTRVSNLTFYYYPAKSDSFSNAVFRVSYGTVQNCVIENKSSTRNMSMVYWNRGPSNYPRAYNCIVKANGRYVADYNDDSAIPLYRGCLFDFTPSLGIRQNCLIRTVTDDDSNLATLPEDLKNVGYPSYYNPNGFRSHIGVCGGPYAWGWSWPNAQLGLVLSITSTTGHATTYSDKAETFIVQNQVISIRASAYSITTGRMRAPNIWYRIKSTTGKARVLPKKCAAFRKHMLTASGHSATVNWWTHTVTASGYITTIGANDGGQLHFCHIVTADGHIYITAGSLDSQIVFPCRSTGLARLIPSAHNNYFYSVKSKTGKATTSPSKTDVTKIHMYPITSITGHARTNGRARIPPANEHIIRGTARIRTYPYCSVDMDYYLYIIGFRRVHWIPTSGTAYYNVYRSDLPGQAYYKMGTAPHQRRPHYKVMMDLKPRNLTATRTTNGVQLQWDNPLIDGYPITIKPVPVGSDQQEKYTPSPDVAWLNDYLPDGSSWIDQQGMEVSDFRYHGDTSIKITSTNGTVEPSFSGATTTMPEGYIVAWIYLDKDNVPDSFWFSFYDNGWEHSHYWSKDRKSDGEIGSESRLFIEELPTPGLWTPVVIDTRNINAKTISGMKIGVNKKEGTGILYLDSVYYTTQYVTKMDFPHIGIDFKEPYIVKKFGTTVKTTDQKEFIDNDVINVYGFTNTGGVPKYSFTRDPILNNVTITWGIPLQSGTEYEYSVATRDMCGVRSEFAETSIVISDVYDHTDITISSPTTSQFTVTVTDSVYEHQNVTPGEIYHYKFETKDSNNNTIAVVETDYQIPYGSVLGNFRLGKSVLA